MLEVERSDGCRVGGHTHLTHYRNPCERRSDEHTSDNRGTRTPRVRLLRSFGFATLTSAPTCESRWERFPEPLDAPAPKCGNSACLTRGDRWRRGLNDDGYQNQQ